jgi:hypothetical protein
MTRAAYLYSFRLPLRSRPTETVLALLTIDGDLAPAMLFSELAPDVILTIFSYCDISTVVFTSQVQSLAGHSELELTVF